MAQAVATTKRDIQRGTLSCYPKAHTPPTNLALPERACQRNGVHDEHYMEIALAEARQAAALGEVPIGAVVACDGAVVATAHNLRETVADPLGHAEILALRAAGKQLGRWRLTGCTLYVTVEPCPMCAGAVVASRIDRLVYGAADPRAGAAGSVFDVVRDPRLNHRAELSAGVLSEACGEVVREFFARRRREASGSLP